MVNSLPNKRRAVWLPLVIIFLASIFYGYQYVLRVMPSLMSVQLLQLYHFSAERFASVSAGFYMGYIPMQVIAGVLIDRYGPRLMLSLACVLCVAASLLFTTATCIHVVILARILLGVGGAFSFIGLLKLSLIWLPRRFFGLFTGAATALGMLGGVFGDAALITNMQESTWRFTSFWIGIAGLVLALMLLLCLHDVRNRHKRSSIGHFYSVIKVLLSKGQIWLCGVVAMLLFLPVSVLAETWGILYLQQNYDYSRVHAADLTAMLFLGWVVGAPLVGYLSDRFGHHCSLIALGSTLATLISAAILYLPTTPYVVSYGLFFMFGFFSSVQVLLFVVARWHTPRGHSATAFGVVNLMVTMGGLVSLFSGAILHTAVHRSHDKLLTMSVFTHAGYQLAFLIIPVALLLAVFLSMYLRTTQKRC